MDWRPYETEEEREALIEMIGVITQEAFGGVIGMGILKCKFCGSSNIVKCGRATGGGQRYLCKKCGRKFVDTRTLPYGRATIPQISATLSAYYGGMSLKEIKRHIGQLFRDFPSRSTIYRWLTKYTRVAINETRKHTPKVGDTWVADETVLKVKGQKMWYFDIIDYDTRFLLATHMSRVRTSNDAKALVEKASQRAGKVPKVIITDKLPAYIDGIELAFGAETKHIRSKPFENEESTNLIERFHSSIKTRTKVMRGLKSRKTAQLLTDGWLTHYNFFREHESLGDRTPAEKAGIRFPFKDWLDVVKSQAPKIPETIKVEITPVKDKIKPVRKKKPTKAGKQRQTKSVLPIVKEIRTKEERR